MVLAFISKVNPSKIFWNMRIWSSLNDVIQSWIKTYDYAPDVYKYALNKNIKYLWKECYKEISSYILVFQLIAVVPNNYLIDNPVAIN